MTKTRKKRRHGRPITGKAFVTYLKYHRMLQGLSQEDLAKAARMSQSHYCDIERGLKRPGPGQIENLAMAIKRPKEEVIGKLYGVDPRDMVCEPAQGNGVG